MNLDNFLTPSKKPDGIFDKDAVKYILTVQRAVVAAGGRLRLTYPLRTSEDLWALIIERETEQRQFWRLLARAALEKLKTPIDPPSEDDICAHCVRPAPVDGRTLSFWFDAQTREMVFAASVEPIVDELRPELTYT